MNKAQLTEQFQNYANSYFRTTRHRYFQLNKKEAKNLVNCFIESISVGLKKSGHVKIASFGTFKVREYAERTVFSPRDGKRMSIPARTKVKFRPSQNLNWEVER